MAWLDDNGGSVYLSVRAAGISAEAESHRLKLSLTGR
jgi:hypothetical protein